MFAMKRLTYRFSSFPCCCGVLILLLCILCTLSCRQPAAEETQPDAAADAAVEPQLQSADLVFVGIPADYRIFNTSSFGNVDAPLNYIHVAILEVDGDSLWVIDATAKRGVHRHPLDTLLADFTLRDGSLPSFVVMRLVNADDPARFIAAAKQYIGQPYDFDFSLTNQAQYCSELVYNSFLSPDNQHLLPLCPMDFNDSDGKIMPYWQDLFDWLKAPVPQGVIGTVPNDMCSNPDLRYVTTLGSFKL